MQSFGIICFENLNVKDMLKNNHLAKEISDASWARFIQFVLYKAESAGRVCVLVDPRNTTRTCSRCGRIVAIALSERTFSCPYCALEIDRDLNAAKNILRLGLQSLSEKL